jgi:integrase/recombinase XerD
MTNLALLGPWLRRFLVEHLLAIRNLSINTQHSYRDTFRLLLPFLTRHAKKPLDRLLVEDVSVERIKAFLTEVEQVRKCGIATRNQRLAAIRSLAYFIGQNSPEHLQWYTTIHTIPFKKARRPVLIYLEKPEINALLAAAHGSSPQQRRDHALLLFLYNTGVRADEAAHVTIADLNLAHVAKRNPSSVTVRGKGNKLRQCPLWPQTVSEIMPLIQKRNPAEHVFLNRCAQPITRFGIHTLVERYVQRASVQMPSMKNKRISPHAIRHTTATHLLRAGVDINTIRAWLGHVSINTTNVYAEIDLEMKAKALAMCEVGKSKTAHPWQHNQGLMPFLDAL